MQPRKLAFYALLLHLVHQGTYGQTDPVLDSLKQVVEAKKGDSSTANALFTYGLTHQEAYEKSVEAFLLALELFRQQRNDEWQASCHLILQGTFRATGQFTPSLDQAKTGLQLVSRKDLVDRSGLFTGQRFKPLFLAEIAQTYLMQNQLDSAKHYTELAIEENEQFHSASWNFPIYLLATIQGREGKYQEAIQNFRKAIPLAVLNQYYQDTLQNQAGMSSVFRLAGNYDSARKYATMVVESTNPGRELHYYLEALENLVVVYKSAGIKDSIIKFMDLRNIIRDSTRNLDRDRKISQIRFDEHMRQNDLENRQKIYASNVRQIGLLAGLLALGIISFLLMRSNRQKQKSKAKIEKAYSELKSTQQQLIQSEKLSSLGQVTAGIAHEIQNPVNFINNFAELNIELLDEIGATEIRKGDSQMESWMQTFRSNSRRILEHGQKADGIIKSMLQHARPQSDKKELTDISALCDTYIRIAQRNASSHPDSPAVTVEKAIDSSLPRFDINPQQIGQAFLNILNNAFYAVQEKSRTTGPGYEPRVTVRTSLAAAANDQPPSAIITIADNGPGIPDAIKDKIFQPFFTTKPTGQGTGLGLSLSYDIAKAHGGSLELMESSSAGTRFQLRLPQSA